MMNKYTEKDWKDVERGMLSYTSYAKTKSRKMKFSSDEYFWLRDVIKDAIKRRKASGIAIDSLREKFDLENVI
jgi:superfamily I DNA and/or RNA helicase